MAEPDAHPPMDPRMQQLIELAWDDAPPLGQREKVLAAISVAAEKRARANATASAPSESPPTVLIRPRRTWPVVVAAIVAIAAAVVLLLHERERAPRMVTPGTEWTPGSAAPVPPGHHPP